MSNTVFSLSTRSDEFRRVDYLLKLSLRTSAIHDVAIWHFSNQHHSARFQDRTRDLEVLHAWVDADQLESSLDTLATRGFVFGANGQVFTTGTLPFDDRDDQTPRRLILCQIGVGRSFVQDELARGTADDDATERRLPDGFDSIFLARPQEESSDAVYRHEYVLFDPLQALPMYLVQYVPGSAPNDRNKRLLDWPTNNTSTTVSAVPPPVVEALYDRYDFFDPVWYVPVSVRDKMVGSHSAGEAAQHKLIGIADAYDAAINESLKPDALITQRQNEIKSQLRAIDAKLRDVNRNSAEVEERIYKALQDALFQLQDLTQQKMNALLSEEVELRRQLQHIDWIETFLDRQRDEAEPVDFLNAWKCHVQLRGDMCRNPLQTSEVLQTVHADLEFEGQVRVIATSAKDRFSRALPNKSSTKRKQQQQQGTPLQQSSNRQGSGSMTMTGTPSPIQDPQAAALNGASFHQQQAPIPMQSMVDPQQQQLLTSDVDVSRAFIEALRLQKEALPKEQTTSGGMTVRNFEVPPTPPSIRKPKKAQQIVGRTPEALLQYSMSMEAQRKSRTMGNFMPDPQFCFAASRIVSAEAGPLPAPPAGTEEKTDQPVPAIPLSDAQTLFLNLPVHSRSRTELLYATWNVDVASIQDLIQTIPKQQILVQDGEQTKTVELPEHCPTVLIIKANGRVFGGYASDSWRLDGDPFGTAKSFLFSLDNDVKIPFVGREFLPPGRHWVESQTMRGLPAPRFASLVSDAGKLQFGTGDLVLANDFRQGASEIESSYGIGLGQEDAEKFLAGAPRFVCDVVELWAVRS